MPEFTKEQKKQWAIKKQEKELSDELDYIQERLKQAQKLRDDANQLEAKMEFQLYQVLRRQDISNLKWKKTPIDFSAYHWRTKYDSRTDHVMAEEGRVGYLDKGNESLMHLFD